MEGMEFRDRKDAGKRLGFLLANKHYEHPVVLGVPRGGVVVAKEVAQALACPLDIVVTRKLGAPRHEELAIGAVDRDGQVVLNEERPVSLGISDAYLEHITKIEQEEILRRERVFRGNKPLPDLSNKTVLIVDDGIATGATTRAAVQWVRRQHPKKVILAVPVAPQDTVERLKEEVDDLVVLSTPLLFFAVGQFYQTFEQVSDGHVTELLS